MCNGGKNSPLIAGQFINVTGSTIPNNEHYGKLCEECCGKGCDHCNKQGWFPNKVHHLDQHRHLDKQTY